MPSFTPLSRRSVMRAPALAMSLLVAVGAAILGVASPAAATTATLSGTVVNESDAALSGVEVELVVADQWGGYSDLTSVQTDADGDYQFTGLEVGDYALLYTADGVTGGPYSPQWYLGAAEFYEATIVTLGDPSGSTVLDTVQLAQSATLSGTVTDAGGSPLADVQVSMTRVVGDYVYRDTFTDVNGNYTVTSLPAGEYELSFRPFASAEFNYVSEWWNDAGPADDPTRITVASGDELTGFDADLAAGGVISGTVVGADAPTTGLEGIEVSVDSYTYLPLWTSQYTTTDENGDYSVYGLPVGDARIQFSERPYSGTPVGYLSQWWDGAATFAEADPVTIAATGATVSGIDAALELGGTLSGVVTGPLGAPVEGAFVSAVPTDLTSCLPQRRDDGRERLVHDCGTRRQLQRSLHAIGRPGPALTVVR